MKNFAKYLVLIGLLLYLLSEKEVLALVTHAKRDPNCKCRLILSILCLVISPTSLYKQLQLLIKPIKILFDRFSELRLQLSGDIEVNPGPQIIFKALTNTFHNKSKRLKFFHVNAQSLVRKRLVLEDIVRDLGTNTIFGISETWLKETDDLKLWKINPNNFKTFRADRDTPTKECGGGVMLIIPSSLNPKVRNDLNYMNKKHFECLWIECCLNNSAVNKQT